jgi:flagellar motor switch protein FliG
MLTGPEKAAILLSLVGEEIAANLVATLGEGEMKLLRQGVHRMANIEKTHVDRIFAEVCDHLGTTTAAPNDTTDYLRRVLAKAIGPEKADTMLTELIGQDEKSSGPGIDVLQSMDGQTLAGFLKDEYPQTIAFILAHLSPALAGEVLSVLGEEAQKEVVYRLTQLTHSSPEVIDEVGKVLRNEIHQVRGKALGGAQPVADMLNYVDKATEERVLSGITESDPELAESIRGLMFVFDDLSQLDGRSVQVLIREVGKDKWVLALRTASPQLKEKIFSNMSERAGILLREELESNGPVRLRDVEKAQKDVLDLARQLEADGQIFLKIGKGGKEDLLV